jgi:hypothetical protein
VAAAYFEPAALRQLVEEHVAGLADRTHHLWALLMFVLWHRQVLSGESVGHLQQRLEPLSAAA